MKEVIVALFLISLLNCCHSEDPSNPVEATGINDTIHAANIPQSENHILGDKLLRSKLRDENGLKSPDIIAVLGEFEDSTLAMRKMKQLLKTDSMVKFLNISQYHFTDKEGGYILYKHALLDPNEMRFTTYPKTYRTDGNIEIYKIRHNNFYQDSSLAPSELASYYSAYDVSALDDSAIMYIEQKDYYSEARPFCRLIKYNSNNKQMNTLTFNDYRLESVLDMPNDKFLITLADAEFGARFNYSTATARLIIIDKELNILNEIHIFYKGAVVTEMHKKDQSYFLGLKFHVLCADCNSHHCYFKIELNEDLEEQNVEITSLPMEINIPIDSVMSKLKITHSIK